MGVGTVNEVPLPFLPFFSDKALSIQIKGTENESPEENSRQIFYVKRKY